MLRLAQRRVYAVQVADVAPVEHHGHVTRERAIVVPNGRSEFGVSFCERAQRIPTVCPGRVSTTTDLAPAICRRVAYSRISMPSFYRHKFREATF
jgi:hypothetical protein